MDCWTKADVRTEGLGKYLDQRVSETKGIAKLPNSEASDSDKNLDAGDWRTVDLGRDLELWA